MALRVKTSLDFKDEWAIEKTHCLLDDPWLFCRRRASRRFTMFVPENSFSGRPRINSNTRKFIKFNYEKTWKVTNSKCQTIWWNSQKYVVLTSSVILQSHYPNRRSPDGRWAKNGKIGRRRPIVGRRRHRFWQIFWSADDFFVEAPKLKVSLTDPPIFRGFVIGEASGDGRPMIGRQSADFLKIFSSWYRSKVARSSGDDRQTVGRWHFIKEPSADRRRISAVIRPMIARLSADHKLWVSLYCVYCMYSHDLWNYIMHLFYFGIYFNLTSCTSYIWFLCWISNWTLPKSVRNRCVIEVFGGVCVCCPLVFEFFVGTGGFVIGLGQISFFFSSYVVSK